MVEQSKPHAHVAPIPLPLVVHLHTGDVGLGELEEDAPQPLGGFHHVRVSRDELNAQPLGVPDVRA